MSVKLYLSIYSKFPDNSAVVKLYRFCPCDLIFLSNCSRKENGKKHVDLDICRNIAIVLFDAECVIYMKTGSAVPIVIIYHVSTPPGNLKCQNVLQSGFVVQ